MLDLELESGKIVRWLGQRAALAVILAIIITTLAPFSGVRGVHFNACSFGRLLCSQDNQQDACHFSTDLTHACQSSLSYYDGRKIK